MEPPRPPDQGNPVSLIRSLNRPVSPHVTSFDPRRHGADAPLAPLGGQIISTVWSLRDGSKLRQQTTVDGRANRTMAANDQVEQKNMGENLIKC